MGVEVTDDPAPEKLNRRVGSVGGMHAAASELQEPPRSPRPAQQWRKIILTGRIEAAASVRDILPQEAVGANDGFRRLQIMINDQQMIANIIEGIDIPPGHFRNCIGTGLHLFIKDAKSQRLGCCNFMPVLGEPNFKAAGCGRRILLEVPEK